MKKRMSKLPGIVTMLILLFFYAPLIVVTFTSFNASKYGGNWTGFSLKWYRKMLTDRVIWEAFGNTLLIATVSTILATILGVSAALALHRGLGRFQKIQYVLIYSPLVVPDILLGISLLLLFVSCSNLLGFQIQLGMTTVIIAHVTFCVSYVAMVVLGRLQDFDDSLVEAALDLGASRIQAFFRVTLPIIAPAIFAGALFAFTLSIDDFVITFFVKGAGSSTLPIYIQSAMRRGTPAVINALSVVSLCLTFLIVFASQKLLRKKI